MSSTHTKKTLTPRQSEGKPYRPDKHRRQASTPKTHPDDLPSKATHNKHYTQHLGDRSKG
ncbi:Hypothetical predicted protein, partial [Pelobates cultripes]